MASSDLKAWIAGMPKAELHVHLEGKPEKHPEAQIRVSLCFISSTFISNLHLHRYLLGAE